jgi:hypothetical protein
MDAGELLTRGTVDVALALYATALALRCLAAGRRPALEAARLAWTGGCLAFVAHVGCAFQFYHGWSHSQALAATAERTAEVVGLAWGGGLYANYAFGLVWAADAGWWWLRPEGYRRRPAGLEAAVQGFLGFMAFNATVVFGAGVVRWVGLAASLGLLRLAAAAWRRRG